MAEAGAGGAVIDWPSCGGMRRENHLCGMPFERAMATQDDLEATAAIYWMLANVLTQVTTL